MLKPLRTLALAAVLSLSAHGAALIQTEVNYPDRYQYLEPQADYGFYSSVLTQWEALGYIIDYSEFSCTHCFPTDYTVYKSGGGVGDPQPSDTPEPVSLALLGSGLVGVGLLRRRSVA